MNLIERNKELMKKFETMINTADENLAEELVDANAHLFILLQALRLFTEEKVIYLLFIG